MGFYVIVIACFCSSIFSYVTMTTMKHKPPEKWGDWPYSKSKLALWLNKSREESKLLGPLRVDRFHFAEFIASLSILAVSIVLFSIDVLFDQLIYELLGEMKTVIVVLIVLLVPVFLKLFWSPGGQLKIEKRRRI